MQDFLLNIDNKEILIEILHHSIDYLIGNRDDQQIIRTYKYGFNSHDDFMVTTRTIARCYRNFCADGGSEAELLSEFSNLSPELQRLVPSVLAARRPEVMKYLVRTQNAQEYPLIESFHWELVFIMGDSSFAQNRRQLVSVTFNCRNSTGKYKTLHFQMNRQKLDDLIATLELAVKNEKDNKSESENAKTSITKL